MTSKPASPGSVLPQEPIFCPLCCAAYIRLWLPNLEVRTAAGDIHSAESRRLAAYLCHTGHVFFVCERDLE